MKKSILMITPENKEINRFRKRQVNNFIQITMPYLAAFVDESKYEITLIDEYNQKILFKKFYDLVVITVNTSNAPHCYNIAKIFKDKGSTIVDNTAISLQKIIDTTNKTIGVVDEIAKSSDEQASAITQVTLGVEQISSVVQTNSATSEESAAASEELSGQAQMLKSLIDKFNLKNKYSKKSISFSDEDSNVFETNNA